MITLIVSALVTGVIIGGLGRLVLPGRQNIGWGATIAAGIVAALIGGGVSYVFGFHERVGLVFLLEVALAAVCVSIVAKAQAGKSQA